MRAALGLAASAYLPSSKDASGLTGRRAKTLRGLAFEPLWSRLSRSVFNLGKQQDTSTSGIKQLSSQVRVLRERGDEEASKRKRSWMVPFTSFIIYRNVSSVIPHDFHNLEGTMVFSVTLGDFKNGGVWVERDAADDPLHLPVECQGG